MRAPAPGPVVFLVNPASANGSTGRRWPEIEQRATTAGLVGETLMSERPGHLVELAERAAGGGAGLLVAVGGDGTVHEVVNGLIRSGRAGEVDFAVLSRGTGKDFVRSLRIPGGLDGAIETARTGRTRVVDVGLARFTGLDGSPAEAYFANFAGAGISGSIARRANVSSKALGGKAAFMWSTVAVFMRWKSADVAVDVDGAPRSGRMFEVLAMNGDYTAGGMWMAPDAKADDGVFDVVLIGDVTKLDFALTFPKIYRGRHVGHPKIEHLQGRTVSVDSVTPLPIALDGEQPGTTPVTFEIVPHALRLRVP
ncbi:MAG TPA: diacylglycerol kinase family protein [Gaiellaceae bacterium]|nr:diacylglycerol kinase family protein [Gaiellaceae bacterium]